MRLWQPNGGLSHKAHRAKIIDDVANNMKSFEPKKIEALGLLGAMAQEENLCEDEG